uniref:HTTM domain-containing protein n=1 Tax=Meloidogyne hapla TaxID=6305 RepID=A0A1I8BGB7_MELHA
MILALNRCIEMYDRQLAEKLFSGNKIFYWIISSLIYGFILGFFTIPPMPNGILVGWFWNPHIVYFQDLEGMVFLQVLLIGLLHMFVTLLYVYMQYFPVPIWVVMSASYAWITSQGYK